MMGFGTSPRQAVGFVAPLLVLLLVPLGLEATPIGTFSMVGLGNVRFGNSFIDWGQAGPVFESATYPNCVPGPNPGACVIDGSTTGTALFTAGTGSFSLIAGLPGTILDLEDDFAPAGSGFVLNNFLAGVPGVTFTATFMPLGTGTLAGCTNTVGDVCTVPGSALTVTNLAGGSSSLSLTIQGFATDAGGSTPFEGRFATQFGLTAAQLVATIQANGWVQSSWSADFELSAAPVPEPSSLLLLGIGSLHLLGAAVLRRRSNR